MRDVPCSFPLNRPSSSVNIFSRTTGPILIKFGTVPEALTITIFPILSCVYPILTCVYPIISCVYPMRFSVYLIVKTVYEVFPFSVAQVLRLSGFAFIVWIGIFRHFHEQINEKPRDLLHFVIIVGLLNIANFYLP